MNSLKASSMLHPKAKLHSTTAFVPKCMLAIHRKVQSLINEV